MKKDEDECSHENLKYHDMDLGNPSVIYEEWTCQDCRASVVKVYEPSYALIYPEEDGQDPYRSEEVIE